MVFQIINTPMMFCIYFGSHGWKGIFYAFYLFSYSFIGNTIRINNVVLYPNILQLFEVLGLNSMWSHIKFDPYQLLEQKYMDLMKHKKDQADGLNIF